ncbi:IS200/IS605 family transposase [Roseimaritima ulvae]|uniref:Transposase IS200 like protein n=1 Tax=Roseimaritima ulvae TaxID=980254 RepID=A0A5B9QND2_9BACT|nr:IS200/IS605 family transposase [Roseimaritima ulvae]QEG40518.1 Transposase IS200 like protein [Roseimaritima ulvae]
MSTYTNLLFHVVYSTKYRKRQIREAWQDELYNYIGGIIRDEKGVLLRIGGIEDHVHLLARFSPTIAVSDMLRLIKCNSSKWVNERDDVRTKFEWQTGYSAFSVSESQSPVVDRYISNQKEHHRARTFEEEIMEMLERHGIRYDPRYVFEQEIVQ